MATLKQLQTFLAVAEYKKMSDAAKHLYLSQPTVSQTITALEEEYGVPLFQRGPKELKITPSGQLLLSAAQEIIAIHKNLEQSMKHTRLFRPLRVGATITIGNTILSPLITRLNKQYPDIDVSVLINNTQAIEHGMLHNELDIALAEGRIVREEILTEPVISDHLELICGKAHPFARRSSIAIDELRKQRFIMREHGSGTRSIFEHIMLTHHIPLQIQWECSSSTAIIDAVRHNLGLAVLSRRCVREFAQKGEIHICALEKVSMKRYFTLCYNKNHPMTSQMQDFAQIVKCFEIPGGLG